MAIVPVVLSSCNKDDDDETSYSYMTGTLAFTVPTYLPINDTLTLTPSGITEPDADSLGYYWYTSFDTTKDTTKTAGSTGDGSWTLITGSAIGSYTVTCTAYASNYYSSTATATIYVVDTTPNTTITGLELTSYPSFVDSRDGKTYYTSTFGGKTFMRTNLGYNGSGISYYNCEVMDELFGRFYSWDEAQEACPSGWHLPSEQEFVDLADSAVTDGSFSVKQDFKDVAGAFMADAYFLSEKMWEYWPQVNITNTTGFSAIPVGYITKNNTSYTYTGLDAYAAFWTSDDDGDDRGLIRYMYEEDPDVHVQYMDKDVLASVRCIKD